MSFIELLPIRLKELREERGYSSHSLTLCGFTQVSNWERGTNIPTFNRLEEYLFFLECSLFNFFSPVFDAKQKGRSKPLNVGERVEAIRKENGLTPPSNFRRWKDQKQNPTIVKLIKTLESWGYPLQTFFMDEASPRLPAFQDNRNYQNLDLRIPSNLYKLIERRAKNLGVDLETQINTILFEGVRI